MLKGNSNDFSTKQTQLLRIVFIGRGGQNSFAVVGEKDFIFTKIRSSKLAVKIALYQICGDLRFYPNKIVFNRFIISNSNLFLQGFQSFFTINVNLIKRNEKAWKQFLNENIEILANKIPKKFKFIYFLHLLKSM